MEDWSKGAREVAVLDSRQQSPRALEQLEESRYEPGLTLVDSGSDPRAWLALVQPSGTCAAHATSPDYLRHSPCPSTGSYHGEKRRLQTPKQNHLQQATWICSGDLVVVLLLALKVSDRQKEHYFTLPKI